jgi:hypothetical protein
MEINSPKVPLILNNKAKLNRRQFSRRQKKKSLPPLSLCKLSTRSSSLCKRGEIFLVAKKVKAQNYSALIASKRFHFHHFQRVLIRNQHHHQHVNKLH